MIVVTGSKGFVGRAFLERLTRPVLGVDFEDCEEFMQDFRDWNEVKLVVHQGAISDTSFKDPDKLRRFNVDYSIDLISLATTKGIPIKYASSASVYGSKNADFSELTPYAKSKLLVDQWVLENLNRFDSLVQGFRYFNVYGPGEESKALRRQASPVSTFIAAAEEGRSIKVFEGSEGFMRDFVFVGDIVDVVLGNREGSGVYDLGSGTPLSFLDVANIVADKYVVSVETIPFPEDLKSGYQTYTKSQGKWEHEFKAVEDYVKDYYLDQRGF